jgi:NAD(P)-dependent dehydrogenase (short-subunit alcohol dehydrogenase family)
MELGLRGKTAVITGASIGLAVAEGLAAEGANIVMAARQKDRLTKEARRVAKQYKVKTLAVACDVATAKGAKDLIAATKMFGGAERRLALTSDGASAPGSLSSGTDRQRWTRSG